MKKYLIYLAERFPLKTHIPIIAVFTFSAICYALMAGGETQFVAIRHYLLAFYLTFSLFLLLRISDEFKDHEDDLKYRKYLPVPRGLITLKQLRNVGLLLLAFQLLIVVLYPPFLPVYLIAMVYLTLMFKEFFAVEYLRKHQLLYVFSHMLIIPLVDLVASSAYWRFADVAPPEALIWFFGVSFFNGILLEIGRKIKMPEQEEEGVISYSAMWGMKKAVCIWIGVLAITLMLAIVAARSINSPYWVFILLGLFAIASTLPALLFLYNPGVKKAKAIENVSGLWTMGMYLNLGALPFIIQYMI